MKTRNRITPVPTLITDPSTVTRASSLPQARESDLASLREFWRLDPATRSRLSRRKPAFVVKDGQLVRTYPTR